MLDQRFVVAEGFRIFRHKNQSRFMKLARVEKNGSRQRIVPRFRSDSISQSSLSESKTYVVRKK